MKTFILTMILGTFPLSQLIADATLDVSGAMPNSSITIVPIQPKGKIEIAIPPASPPGLRGGSYNIGLRKHMDDSAPCFSTQDNYLIEENKTYKVIIKPNECTINS